MIPHKVCPRKVTLFKVWRKLRDLIEGSDIHVGGDQSVSKRICHNRHLVYLAICET